MGFIRGLDPKEAMGTGWRAVYKSMGHCLFLTEKDIYQNINNQYFDIQSIKISNIRKQSRSIYEALIIIVVFKDQFRIMKNRFSYPNFNYSSIYEIEELPKVIFKLKEQYDNYMNY